jgi:hypothetical protein
MTTLTRSGATDVRFIQLTKCVSFQKGSEGRPVALNIAGFQETVVDLVCVTYLYETSQWTT